MSYQLEAIGGTPPYTWFATSLPAGVSLSSSGLISGTPAGAVAASYTVTVTDDLGATANLQIYFEVLAIATPALPFSPIYRIELSQDDESSVTAIINELAFETVKERFGDWPIISTPTLNFESIRERFGTWPFIDTTLDFEGIRERFGDWPFIDTTFNFDGIRERFGTWDLISVGIDFVFSVVNDANGLFYYYGTNYGAGAWTNPVTAGRLVGTPSSRIPGLESYGDPAELVNRSCGFYFFTDNFANSWVMFDLGSGKRMKVTDYVIQSDIESSNFLRSWKLQGSNDVSANTVAGGNAATWTDLDTRTSNTSITAACQAVRFTASGTGSYRWIRILQTGLNSGGSNYLEFGELELYGTWYS